MEQAVVSQRAMKHAAWGAKKEIRSKLHNMKKSPYNADMKPVLPRIAPLKSQGAKRVTTQGVKPKPGQKIVPPTTPPSTPKTHTTTSPPVAGKFSVLATPVGFRKVREESRQQTASEADPLLWKIGEDYGMSTYL